MKLHLQNDPNLNIIHAYADAWVRVNEQTYTHSLIVTPQRIIADWQPRQFAALTAAHFAPIVELRPQVLLLGTGPRLRFPNPALTASLHSAGIGVEVMDIGAACRTYNILTGEGRQVAAALLIEETG